jgi:hypothetical protein
MADKKASSGGFSKEERAAMRERARELKAATSKAENLQAVVDTIEAMPEPDRSIVGRLHALIVEASPTLLPKLWYGMPAYAVDGAIICFVQPAAKFSTRYSTLGFNDSAALDDGAVWPTAYAITGLTASDEKRISELIARALG